jgi:hypothetical protein
MFRLTEILWIHNMMCRRHSVDVLNDVLYFDTSLKTSRRDCSVISSSRDLSHTWNFFFSRKNRFLRKEKRWATEPVRTLRFLCEVRTPVTHQEHRRRCEVSEEEFERIQTLVKQESWQVLLPVTTHHLNEPVKNEITPCLSFILFIIKS